MTLFLLPSASYILKFVAPSKITSYFSEIGVLCATSTCSGHAFTRVAFLCLNLRCPVKDRSRNEIFETGFLHGCFWHRDAGFVGALDRLGGVDDHLGGHDVVGLRRIESVAFDIFNDVH